MKKTIKGVTYDTETAESFVWNALMGEDQTLSQTKTGHFFLFAMRPLVDGKLVPKGKDPGEILPALFGDQKSIEHKAAQARLAWRGIIKPLTRRQALAWCIKTQMPRTFHKELARFLK
ncbi:MAG: hypothetical protein WCH99_19985 [Verrucomicrobiota bacterium]